MAINGLGYEARLAQLLTVPVYIGALIFVLVCAILADRYKIRRPFITYPYMLSATAFILLLALPADRWPGARYGILFLAAIGINTPVTGALSWATNNLAGSWKRSIGVAVMMTVSRFAVSSCSSILVLMVRTR